MSASAETSTSRSTAHPIGERLQFHLRPMLVSDLPAVVALHVLQFPDGFYARLGPTFMRRYFAEYLRSPGTVGFVTEGPDHGLIGYLVGTIDDAAHRCFTYRTSWVPVTGAGAVALAARPTLWWVFASRRAAWYGRRLVRGIVTAKRDSREPRSAELLYICTSPAHRRLGCGAALLRAFVEAAQRAQAARVHLIAESKNLNAQDFYSHRGWSVRDETVARDDRPLVTMTLTLGGPCA